VIVPQQPGLEMLVKVGDRVRGGTTVLARVVQLPGQIESAQPAAVTSV
jgi:hypothetical protein